MPDHIGRMIRNMKEPRYKESEAASLVGVSVDTLRRWRRSGKFTPSDQMSHGALTVALYTPEDIDGLKMLAKKRG